MAEAVLGKSPYFNEYSRSFQDDLAKLMVACDSPEGHVFINEGDHINSFLIVESGTLYRTKRQTDEGSEVETPFQIDVVGPGGVAGFLHVAGASPDEEVAFATIVAGKGGARVWEVSGDDFRKMCESNPMVSDTSSISMS
jgi:CRP-like cAMP-binding protein